jgi:hypothetical protein
MIPQPIARWNQGYAWHLKDPLFSWDEKAGIFYDLAFSPEENALIEGYDANITKLGLLDTSFLYSIFEKGIIQEKKAKAISIPLTRMKKGILKTIECYPLATFKEIEAASSCQWGKGNIIIEAETIQPEGTDFVTAINSVTFGSKEESFFQNQYSSVKKAGLVHILYKADLMDRYNRFESLTNIEQNQRKLAPLHLRKPEACCNMFQLTKLLFHNQVLFEKNVFKAMVEEALERENKNIGNKAFFEKIKVIYEKFEAAKKSIDNISFEFLQKEKIEKIFKPEINFQNTHFKFSDAFSGNSRKTRGVPTAFYLTKKEEKYHIFWRPVEVNSKGENLEEVSAFLKFYLAFCAILQLTTKEFLAEMLPENI